MLPSPEAQLSYEFWHLCHTATAAVAITSATNGAVTLTASVTARRASATSFNVEWQKGTMQGDVGLHRFQRLAPCLPAKCLQPRMSFAAEAERCCQRKQRRETHLLRVLALHLADADAAMLCAYQHERAAARR